MMPLAVDAAESADQSSLTLPVITVYAEQSIKTPASLTKIDRENLDKTGTTDMAGIVKYLPLVSAPFAASGSGTLYGGSGTSGYNIRGVEANRIGLDVDGVDVADASVNMWIPTSMSQRAAGRDYIDPELFSTVDIYSGTTDASADGIGGRVSFKTKSPEDYLKDGKTFGGSVKAGYSSADNAWFSSVTAAAGNETVKGLVAYSHRDGHETEANSKTAALPVDWTSDAVLTRLIWNLNNQNQLGFTFDYYKKSTDTHNMDGTVITTFPLSDGEQTQDVEKKRFALDYIFKPENFVLFDRLNSKLWYQESSNATETAYHSSSTVLRDFSNSLTQKDQGIKFDALKTVQNHTLKYGLLADQRDYSSTRKDLRNGVTLSSLNQAAYMVDAKVDRYALYLMDDIAFNVADRALIVSPSVRTERQEYHPDNSSHSEIQEKNYSYLSPGLSLGYDLTPHTYSYAKYARGNRIPSATELGGNFTTTATAYYILVGNTDLKKETSDAFELGFSNDSIEGIKFDLTGFYTKYHDFIDYYNYGSTSAYPYGYYRAENIADANIWGGELSTHVDLSKFIANAQGYSLAIVAGRTQGSATNDAGVKGPINSIQPKKASLTFAYDQLDHLYGIGATVTGVGGKLASTADVTTLESTNTGYQRVAGYAVYDLSAYWNVNKKTKFNLALNNIFDKTYWNYATVGTLTNSSSTSGLSAATVIDRAAMPGRNVVASLEFKF